MSFASRIVTTATSAGILNKQSQLAASREVNKIEYEQRVNALNTELTQIQLQRQQANIQAAQQLQQNKSSFAEGMYNVLQQRIQAKDQAQTGKDQGIQIQAETANQGTAQYQELLNAALQLEAQQQQEQQKSAQASLFVDPFSISGVQNQNAALQSQVEAFVQNQLVNNQAIGSDTLQSDYAAALSGLLGKLGINDANLTNNMANQNDQRITEQFNANISQINNQQRLNNAAFSNAEKSLKDAKKQETSRYQTDDKNLRLLNTANLVASNPSPYRYSNLANSSMVPATGSLLQAALTRGLTQPTTNTALPTQRQPGVTVITPTNLYGGTPKPQQAPNNVTITNGSDARANLLNADSRNVIVMPGDVSSGANNKVTTPVEPRRGKK